MRKEVRVTLLMLVGAIVMFFSLWDTFDQTTTSVIGWKDVSFHEAPNEFLLTVGARITFGLYCFYLASPPFRQVSFSVAAGHALD